MVVPEYMLCKDKSYYIKLFYIQYSCLTMIVTSHAILSHLLILI